MTRRSGPAAWLLIGLALSLRAEAQSSAREVATRYHDALREWSAYGAEGVAIDALDDLEFRLASRIDCLDWVEGETLEVVLAERPEAILAVLALHLAVWEREIRSARLPLAERSRDLVSETLERWVREEPERRSPAAANVLLIWAERMFNMPAYRPPTEAFDVLEEAHRLDPSNHLVLHLQALLHERLAQPRAALQALEELLSLRPNDAEARLRRAVLSRASDRPEEAASDLRLLTRKPHDRWIREVAYSELAGLALDSDDPTAGRRLLEEANRALPESELLAVQLLYVVDRASRDGRAAPRATPDWLLDAWRRDRGPSARFRYDRGPPELRGGLRSRLDAGLNRLRPALEEVLVSEAMRAVLDKRSGECAQAKGLLR